MDFANKALFLNDLRLRLGGFEAKVFDEHIIGE